MGLTGKASRASCASHLPGLPPGEGGRGARQLENQAPRVGGPVCTSRRQAARKMGVALGTPHFHVDGGTGGSPLPSFSCSRPHPREIASQGAFGLCGCRSDSKKKTQPLGNDRARACVRPRSAAQQAPRAGMVIRRSGPNLVPELNDSKPNAGFPDPDQSIIVPLVYRLLSLPGVPLAKPVCCHAAACATGSL